jgi:hypothetical protein
MTLSQRPAFLEVGDQVGVDHGELAGQVRFDEQVLVGRLDGLADAADVADGRRRCDGHAVGVAHADGLDALAQAIPVERAAVSMQVAAAALGQFAR